MKKKPIYDDDDDVEIVQARATPLSQHNSTSTTALPTTPPAPSSPSASRSSPSSASSITSSSTSPTPTDRLASQIRAARLQLHRLSTRAEASANRLMTQGLQLETSFANTIASLAPPLTANEPLVPGLAYVLVATLAGSIVSRNRTLLLRGAVPVLFGVATGYAVIPHTMRNVGELVWSFEKRYPVVADAHLRIRERARHVWDTGKAHTMGTVARAEGLIEEGREKVEGWVAQGK